MITSLSSKGQIVLPAKVRRQLSLATGDLFTISVESQDANVDRVILTRKRTARPKMQIVRDPLTGWPVLKARPGAPRLTSAMVKQMLVDFP